MEAIKAYEFLSKDSATFTDRDAAERHLKRLNGQKFLSNTI